MKIGQAVYFRHDGKVKTGLVKEELKNDELLLVDVDTIYIRKAWEICVVPEGN